MILLLHTLNGIFVGRSLTDLAVEQNAEQIQIKEYDYMVWEMAE